MQYRKVTGGYLLRIERGEEVMASLLKFTKKYKIKSGFMVGLGACEKLELGYFDAVKGIYKNKKFPGEFEVTNLTGNIAYLGREPIVHVHITLSDDKFNAIAGHLWSAIVSGTVEIYIMAFGSVIKRAKDPETGLNLLKLSKVR
jgi:predicted DNA-binding protein with PD1-like motif